MAAHARPTSCPLPHDGETSALPRHTSRRRGQWEHASRPLHRARRLAELQAAKKLRAEQAEREKVRDRRIRMHVAVRLYDRLVAYVNDLNKAKNKQALDALTDTINRSIALKGYNEENIVVPAFCTETSHPLANSQFLETVCWARLRNQGN